MSEYTIVNGELYHYGVKGMKGATSITAAGIKGAVNNSQNKKLRAYYSHTSNRRKY